MAGYPSSILQLAAAVAVAATLWTVPPAMAAESSGIVSKASVATAKMASSRAARIAASYYSRHFRPIRGYLDCSGGWCGRHFVLMTGIAY
jgi:hypothetical protein